MADHRSFHLCRGDVGHLLLVETRTAEPIITPQLFKNSIFLVSVIAMFLVSAGMFVAILYLPLFAQGVLGESATNSGVVLTPMMGAFIFSSIVGGQLLSRTGRYKVLAIIGFAVAAVGMFLLSRMAVTTTQGEVIRNMIITGLGAGVLLSLFTIVVQNAFPYRQLGEVTASLNFFRSIGSTIGVAVMGTILTNAFQSNLQRNMPQALTAAGVGKTRAPGPASEPPVVTGARCGSEDSARLCGVWRPGPGALPPAH